MIKQSTFYQSFYTADKLQDELPEVAFVGRSNVGKSSVLNTITGKTQLARTSKTPGRTQLINYFKVPEAGFLVDLPGYGYAKVSANMKLHWEKTLGEYFMRSQVVSVVLLVDVRHILLENDQRMFDWLKYHNKNIYVLLTKSDKLNLSKARAAKDKLYAAWKAPMQLFSSHKRQGV